MDIAYLKKCDVGLLEALYKQPGAVEIPTSGSYRGTYLKRLNNPGAQKKINRITLWAMFDLTPFGLNFYPEYGDWYFFHPSFAISARANNAHVKAKHRVSIDAIAILFMLTSFFILGLRKIEDYPNNLTYQDIPGFVQKSFTL